MIAVGGVVVHDGSLLMVQRAHDPGRGLWSLPGGRVESGEYLADAVRREVVEETGIPVELTGRPALTLDDPAAPRQLVRPEGVQLEQITPTHQHIDLIYFARPAPGAALTPLFEPGVTAGGWYGLE